MMKNHRSCRIDTERLLIKGWHSFDQKEWEAQDLATFVQQTLTPAVTQSLPDGWQGHYSKDRARQWISERDAEGTHLLAVKKSDQQAIGLVLLHEMADGHLRLGYLLAESAWGQGFATELVKGLVAWGRVSGIQTITGGVEKNNVASAKVLTNNGFVVSADSLTSHEHVYVLDVQSS